MLFDERIANLVERKHAFVQEATDEEVLHEALRFVRWLLTEDLTRPYLLQILHSDEAERFAYAAHLDATVAEATRLAEEVERIYPQLRDEGAEPLDLDDPFSRSLRHFERYLRSERTAAVEEEDLQRSPLSDPSRAHRMTIILANIAVELLTRAKDPVDLGALGNTIGALRARHEYRFLERSNLLRTSPASALRAVLEILRSLAPPPVDEPDWMPFLPFSYATTHVLAYGRSVRSGHSRVDTDAQVKTVRNNLRRVVDELIASLGTSLSSEVVVSRFKERCTWYDKARTRAIANDADLGGAREDRLTLEIAKYVHDCGIFVLVRPRVANLEPDVITAPRGARRFALESKVYDGSDGPRALKRGLWQLHAYMTSLETNVTYAREGFLVVFRLGGPICETPAMIATERFLFHIVTIDLGTATDSGHAQPKTVVVTREELLESTKAASEPE